MQVTRVSEKPEGLTAGGSRVTDAELQKEYGYYMAQKWLESLLDKGQISVDEFNKITEKNRQSFSPFLAEIMPKMT